MLNFSIAPRAVFASFWTNRQLIKTLVRREVAQRYRGSILGILWSFLNPVFMLAVYTFIFSVVFKARWGGSENDSRAEFALILFAGMLIFNFFAECITRSPNLIISNTTYVKKVIFPLEILPLVCVGSALFNAGVGLIVWLLFSFFVFGVPPATILLLPMIMLPLLLLTLGLTWLLSSLGVFLQDVSQVVGIVVTAMMFLTPIFYPIAAIPESYQFYVYLNPLTFIVEQMRSFIIFGQGVSWAGYGIIMAFSTAVAWLGFAWFQKTRKGFADVL